MRTQQILIRATVVVILFIVAACGGNSILSGEPGETVGSYEQLVSALQSNGSIVEKTGTVSQPFFKPEGQAISLDGQEVQVFEFETEREAASVAESISPDGTSIGTSMALWISSPHFFNAGNLVVIYVGDNQNVIAAFERLLGPQIAGK